MVDINLNNGESYRGEDIRNYCMKNGNDLALTIRYKYYDSEGLSYTPNDNVWYFIEEDKSHQINLRRDLNKSPRSKK